MAKDITRRELLVAGTAAAITAPAATAATPASGTPAFAEEGPKKAVIFSMLPGSLSIEDRMKLARDCGFHGVESSPVTNPAEAERMRAAAEKAGICVHSVIYGGWDPPLTHPDPAKQEQSFKNAVAALHSAKNMGADDILLVPGVVNAETRYVDAYKRSQEHIRRLIPVAEELKVLICVEEVWNNFLLSPMEYAAYIDSFKSRWVHSYFDVGNVVAFAWPEDWIRTVGKRIRKVHIKDYKGGPGLFGSRNGNFVNIRDGSINWPEVRKAFAEVGYTGFMTLELGGGDEAYLRDLSSRFDKILAGV
jgi:Sugar phosphate isomerases/epimerases